MKQFLKFTLIGTAVTFIGLLLHGLALLIPDLIDWLADYVGELTAWLLFITVLLGFAAFCIRLIDK